MSVDAHLLKAMSLATAPPLHINSRKHMSATQNILLLFSFINSTSLVKLPLLSAPWHKFY